MEMFSEAWIGTRQSGFFSPCLANGGFGSHWNVANDGLPGRPPRRSAESRNLNRKQLLASSPQKRFGGCTRYPTGQQGRAAPPSDLSSFLKQLAGDAGARRFGSDYAAFGIGRRKVVSILALRDIT
jgi:hypothetical protein